MEYEYFVKRKLEREKLAVMANKKLAVEKKQCCRDINNLKYAPWSNSKKDKVVLKCKYCGAEHIFFDANPGNISVKNRR